MARFIHLQKHIATEIKETIPNCKLVSLDPDIAIEARSIDWFDYNLPYIKLPNSAEEANQLVDFIAMSIST